MPSTYTSLHDHIVFATKNREPFIADGAAWDSWAMLALLPECEHD